jgi:hypothetical protein
VRYGKDKFSSIYRKINIHFKKKFKMSKLYKLTISILIVLVAINIYETNTSLVIDINGTVLIEKINNQNRDFLSYTDPVSSQIVFNTTTPITTTITTATTTITTTATTTKTNTTATSPTTTTTTTTSTTTTSTTSSTTSTTTTTTTTTTTSTTTTTTTTTTTSTVTTTSTPTSDQIKKMMKTVIISDFNPFEFFK